MNLDRMKILLQEKNICVLATVSGGKPHCSLMAYTTDENCREVYMFTRRSSKKFSNLMENRSVSLLVDSRGESDSRRTQALTVSGRFDPVDDPIKRSRIQRNFLSAHPQLIELVDHPDCELLCIRVEAFLLLDGPSKAHFVEVDA